MRTTFQDVKSAVPSMMRRGPASLLIVASLGAAIGLSVTLFAVASQTLGGVTRGGAIAGPLLLTAAILVWMASAEAANTMLARAINRRGRRAVRSAPGANGLRLVRQLLVEDVVLSLLVASVGLFACVWAANRVGIEARTNPAAVRSTGCGVPRPARVGPAPAPANRNPRRSV